MGKSGITGNPKSFHNLKSKFQEYFQILIKHLHEQQTITMLNCGHVVGYMKLDLWDGHVVRIS